MLEKKVFQYQGSVPAQMRIYGRDVCLTGPKRVCESQERCCCFLQATVHDIFLCLATFHAPAILLVNLSRLI